MKKNDKYCLIIFNAIGKKNKQTSVSDADREPNSEGKRIMPETRFTEFPALSVYSTVGDFSVCIAARC